jgi:hypothetical protein
MKTKLFLLVSIISSSATVPAFASDPMIGDRHLDHVQWFHARPEAQVTNEDPILTDHRLAPASTKYTFVVPPLPAAKEENRIIVLPQQSGLSGTSISPTGLPPSRLGSNLTPNRFSNNLPSGVTIGSHAHPGTILSAPAQSAVKTVHATRHESPNLPITTAAYPASGQTGSSGATPMQTSSSAIGKLLKH